MYYSNASYNEVNLLNDIAYIYRKATNKKMYSSFYLQLKEDIKKYKRKSNFKEKIILNFKALIFIYFTHSPFNNNNLKELSLKLDKFIELNKNK